ncbi:MAG TPA: hypothetical protein VGO57_19050 [Verrucomicrobiae bacterium]
MMKKITFAILGSAAVILTGCRTTVSDTSTFATSWNKDTISGRYARTPEQVYSAAVTVIQHNGVLLNEYIPHDSTNTVKSLEGRVNNEKVWVRVEAVDARSTQVDVQARSSWGTTDVDLVHELEKEIALQLAR